VIGFNLIGILALAGSKFQKMSKGVDNHPRLSKASAILIGLTLLWFGIIFIIGPRIDYGHDAWYHIAHIRQAIEDNQIPPENAYWPDLPLGNAYSVWHPILGAVAQSAGVSALVLWRIGNAFFAALALLVFYHLASTLFEDTTLSLLVTLTVMGAEKLTGTYVYPYGITNIMLWASLGSFFTYYKTHHGYTLLSATAIGLLPTLLHPQEFIFLCFGIAAFLAATLLYTGFGKHEPPEQPNIRAIITYLALLILLGGPLLIARYPHIIQTNVTADANSTSTSSGSFSPHPLAQTLDFLFPHSHKLSSFEVEFMPFKAIAVLISPFVLTQPLQEDKNRFLLALTWGPLLAFAVPGLSYVTRIILRETYAWRIIALIPEPLIIAATIQQALSQEATQYNKKSDISKWSLRAITGIVVILLSLNLIAKIAIGRQFNNEGSETDLLTASPLQTRAMFENLDRAASNASIVLSDPWTSYAIPGMTKHTVVLNMPSHGGRNDMYIRFAEMRKLLSDPTQSREEAIETLERYDIDFIVVSKPQLNDYYYYFGTQFYSPYTLSLLRENVTCFENLYTDERFEIYQFTHCEPVQLELKGQPKSAPFSGEIEQPTDWRPNEDLTLLGYSLLIDEPIAPSREISATLYWKAENTLDEPYAVWLELLCDYPGKKLPYGKGLRLLQERIKNANFETSVALWLPIPPAGLNKGDVLPQSLRLSLPPNLTSGTCDLNTYVIDREQVLYSSNGLPSLLMEQEYLHRGIKLGTVKSQ